MAAGSALVVARGMALAFILEGIPAIVLGIVTIFYLTDRLSQASWLFPDEQRWLVNELQNELEAKKGAGIHDHASVL